MGDSAWRIEHDPHEPFEVCAVARPLIEDFGNVVPTAVLEHRINDETHDPALTVRVHVSRLRKQLAPFRVSISCVRNVGYVMHRNEPRNRAEP